MVTSPNHTFFVGKLEQAINQNLVLILSLVTDKNPFSMNQQMGANDPRNYFMINLHKNMDRAGIELAAPGSAV